MKRTLYEDVHEDFRASFRTFLQREVHERLDVALGGRALPAGV